MASVADNDPAANHDVGDVWGRCGVHRVSHQIHRSAAPARRNRTQSDRREVGQRTRGQPSRSPSEGVGSRGGGSPEKEGRRQKAPPTVRESLVELQRPRLLEQVDDRLAITSQRQRNAGRDQTRRRTNTVAEVALRRRAQADPSSRGGQEGQVTVGDMGGVNGRGCWCERADVGQKSAVD